MMDALTSFLTHVAGDTGGSISRYTLDEMGMECGLLSFLRATTPPQIITCPGCAEACQMRHQKAEGKAFIWCDAPPELGRIDLQPHDLEHWRLDMPALAQWLADALELPPSREIIPRQAFELGVLEGQTLFLIAGDNPEIYMDSRIRNMQPLLLTLLPLPESITLPSLWLGQLLRLDATGLILEKARLYQVLQRQQPAQGNIFRREGEFWRVRYEGKEAHIKHSNGMVYLDYLLHHPNEEVPALVLQGLTHKAVLDAVPVDGEYQESEFLGGEPKIDDKARQEYQSRIEYLKETQPDSQEIKELEAYLRQSTFHGKTKTITDDNERARLAVTKAINGIVKKIKNDLPALFNHLSGWLDTGSLCQYRGKQQRWE